MLKKTGRKRMLLEYNWIIDPIDGTTNFIHSIPVYSISVALSYKDEIMLGIVYEINSKECFHTIKNHPAYVNNKIISVSENNVPGKALIATGFPYHDFSLIDPYLLLFKDVMQNSRVSAGSVQQLLIWHTWLVVALMFF